MRLRANKPQCDTTPHIMAAHKTPPPHQFNIGQAVTMKDYDEDNQLPLVVDSFSWCTICDQYHYFVKSKTFYGLLEFPENALKKVLN